MAFPWIFESNFALGDNSEWDSETDTADQLDFPTFRDLARDPASTSAPSSGTNCLRLALTGGTADAFLTEGDINIADTVTNSLKFDIWFSPDFTGTADDTFAFLELVGSAITGSVGARIVAATDVINMGIGSSATGTVPSQFASHEMVRNTWYTVEATFNIETNGSGTADLFITRIGDLAQATADAGLTTVTNVAVTSGTLGIQDHLATTTGTILIDNFVHDDLRVFPRTELFPREKLITKSETVFIGAGEVSRISLLSGAASDNVLTLHDTSNADSNDASNIVLELKNTSNNELIQAAVDGNIRLARGCFITLTGTDPRALVSIVKAPAYGNFASVRNHGLKSGSLI